MAVVTRLELKGRNGLDKYDKYPIAVNIPVSLNYNLADVRNPDQRKASFSKTINLNGTNEINKLFENIFSVNVATQYFNKNLKTPVRYIVNEIENFSGDLQLIKININPDNSIVYECSIIGAGGSLFVDIGEKYITGNANTSDDLNFSAYNHNYTRANQIASRTTYLGTGAGYVYPLIDRGTNGGSDVIWNVKDFLPCFSIYEYISKIIALTGRTFTSTFLNTAEFKKLYCYSNVTTMNASLAQLQASQLYVGLNSNLNLTIIPSHVTPPFTNTIGANYNFTAFNKETPLPFFDTGNQNLNGIITFAFTKNYNIVYHQKLKLNFTYFDPSFPLVVATTVVVNGLFRVTNYIQKSDIANVWYGLNTTSSQSILFGQNWTQSSAPYIYVSNGMEVATFNVATDYFDTFDIATGDIPITAGNKARQVFEFRHFNNYATDPDFYGNQFTVPEYTFFDAAGNELDSSQGQGTVSLQSVSGVGGSTSYALNSQTTLQEGDLLEVNNSLPTKIKQKDFFKSVVQAFNLYVDVDKDNENNLIIETFDEFYDADIVDYENKTDLAKEQSINPNLLEGKRYIFAYKDDADYYNTLYKNTWNETYGTEQIDVVNDFIKSDKKNELIFSATPQVGNYGMGIAMPKIYQQSEQGGVVTKKTIAANIRMLYCAVKTSPNAYTYKQQGQTDLITNEYLYAGMEDDPFNPTVSLMFGPPKEVYYNYVQAYFTTNNLYNRYHRNYLKNLIDKDAKFVTKYLWLNEKDIYLFDFRNRLFIDGAYYIVNKIENYNPLELTSTKVELVKLLDADVFTPTSVLISEDTGINAGQDIQNYRLNSSLNVGTNIQNRGTNCLAIGENIVIPESCTNLIVFGSNITADENSTGLLLNYKSYVALISQVAPTAATSGLLIIGETYTITTFVAGDNFTNVANILSGTINTTGCVFIAIGTTPTTWTNASTLTSAGNPTAIVLENTLGDIVWSRFGAGGYYGTLTGVFLSNKTFVIGGSADINAGGGDFATLDIRRYDNDKLILMVYDNFTPADSLLVNTSIEIRVYN